MVSMYDIWGSWAREGVYEKETGGKWEVGGVCKDWLCGQRRGGLCEKKHFFTGPTKKIVNCVLMIVSEAIANACRFYKQ